MNKALALLPVVAVSLLGARPAGAERALLPKELVALDSPEGQRMLMEASAREDFFHLAETFVTQEQPSYCGVASSVMVLNALPIAAPDAKPAPMFTQDNIFNEAARRAYPPESVARGGLTLDQLSDLLKSHPTDARAVHASERSAWRSRWARGSARGWRRGGLGARMSGALPREGRLEITNCNTVKRG